MTGGYGWGWGTEMLPGQTRVHYYIGGEAACQPFYSDQDTTTRMPRQGDACTRCYSALEGLFGLRKFSSKG